MRAVTLRLIVLPRGTWVPDSGHLRSEAPTWIQQVTNLPSRELAPVYLDL